MAVREGLLRLSLRPSGRHHSILALSRPFVLDSNLRGFSPSYTDKKPLIRGALKFGGERGIRTKTSEFFIYYQSFRFYLLQFTLQITEHVSS